MIAKLRSHRVFSARPGSIVRYVGMSFLLVLLLFHIDAPTHGARMRIQGMFPSHCGGHQTSSQQQQPSRTPLRPGEHPIAKLMREAEEEFDRKLKREARSLEQAAAEYRKRRGRHPPAGFEVWYKFAVDQHAIVVEDFWDQIYEDLAPFWAVEPAQIRKQSWDDSMRISVRNGTASSTSTWFWMAIWLNMIQHIEGYLPDLDMAINPMDEPRVITPWEDINDLINKAQGTLGMVDPKDAITTYEILPPPGEGLDRFSISKSKSWDKQRPYMTLVRQGCPPDSPVRQTPVVTDFNRDTAPEISAVHAAPHMENGFVSNYRLSTSICHQPDLQTLEGIFIDPLTVSTTKTLTAMFGGSKLSVNNEILIPPAMYWGGGPYRFTVDEDKGEEPAWGDKAAKAFWRGVASGGNVREGTWRGFQRHRFLAMNNGTKLTAVERDGARPENFAMPDAVTYGLKSQAAGRLGEWVQGWADMAFTDLSCVPEEENGRCRYTGPHFEVADGVDLAEMYRHKLLPDVDGNSYSGRYLGFLRSSSLPVKATLFREWHDSRLLAWKHFVPMDPRFGDWHALVEYFLGYRDPRSGEQVAPAHDAEAQRIAAAGRDWARKALRKEDMLVYMLRLLLEFARVGDVNREKMGYVDDLLPPKK